MSKCKSTVNDPNIPEEDRIYSPKKTCWCRKTTKESANLSLRNFKQTMKDLETRGTQRAVLQRADWQIKCDREHLDSEKYTNYSELHGYEYEVKEAYSGKIHWVLAKTHYYAKRISSTEKNPNFENITHQILRLKQWKRNAINWIDEDKQIWPVLKLAIVKAKKLKKGALQDDEIEKWEEVDKYSRVIEDMPIYRVPDTLHLRLRWLSCRYLRINSRIGTELIIEAYKEYYELDCKCPVCGTKFTSVKGGRKKIYCSDACRQKAHRRRKGR